MPSRSFKTVHESIGVTKFHGKHWDIRDLDSIAILLVGENSKRGLYRLLFSNGEMYVGQSVNVVSRFASHRRRWNDIIGFEFYPIPTGDLNAPEKALIHASEPETGLRNIREANRPGGVQDFEISIEDRQNVILPWNRDLRRKSTDTPIGKDTSKFVELASHPAFPVLRSVAGWFLFETCPDPLNTVRNLWVVSCLPSTAKTRTCRRLFTISMGNLEVLFVAEELEGEDAYYTVVINTEKGNDSIGSMLPEDMVFEKEQGQYREAETTRWYFPADELLDIAQADDCSEFRYAFLDAAYALNIRLLRRGGTMFRRFHNEYLASDLIAASMQWKV